MTWKKNSPDTFQRVKQILTNDGAIHLLKKSIKKCYRVSIRRFLPRKPYAMLNGVYVNSDKYKKLRIFDEVLPWEPPGNWYKNENIDSIRTHVCDGDTIIVIGAGFGVTSVIAAEEAGSNGEVIAFEGSLERLETTRETVKINCVDNCQLRHAIVGERIKLPGMTGDPEIISPDELPECDVIEMDCEGAELNILRNLGIKPRNIIVESHPNLGAPESEVKEALSEIGYEITDEKQRHSGAIIVASRPSD